MKKGIECYTDYDRAGKWCLIITKRKGRLTLEEIKEAAREYEWDFYLLVLDCYHEPDDVQYGSDNQDGDMATLYRTDLFFSEGE